MGICKFILALMLLFVLSSASIAQYCYPPTLYILEETSFLSGSFLCQHELTLDEPVSLLFVLTGVDPAYPVSQADLLADSWPALPTEEQGRMEFEWTADIFSGDIWSSASLIWDPPLEPAIYGSIEAYILGRVTIERFSEDWLANPFEAALSVWDCWGTDDDGNDYPILGGQFHFNIASDLCRPEVIIDPSNIPYFAISHQYPLNNSAVAGDFAFGFDVIHQNCWDWWPQANYFSGEVFVDSDLVLEFHDTGFGRYVVDIAVSAYPDGYELPIVIDMRNEGYLERRYEFSYLVIKTPVESVSFSVIKSLY